MVVIEWYNLVAIIVGIISAGIFIYGTTRENGETGFLAGLGDAFRGCLIFVIVLIFYLVWGGIFWW